MYKYKKICERTLYYGEQGYFFRYLGIDILLEDVVRTHNNPWMNENVYPSYIHGIYYFGFYNIGIEIKDDETIIIYKELDDK